MIEPSQQRILEDPLLPRLLGVVAAMEVICGIAETNKAGVLTVLADSLGRSARISVDATYAALIRREELGPTGVGRGIALPHAWIPRCPKVVAAFGRLARPIDWGAVDGMPVDLVFAVVGPDDQPAFCLSAVSEVVRRLRKPGVEERLRQCKDPVAMLALLKAGE